ncbi:hypothetical protein SLEP1_g18189 [Rubroshorea leprosula]|uniref:Uncharacterized protein n=1 Tax=Rubroshorea leprosula TaxID=152421 RepID=A0AAV5J5X2_9ROSI|nr:hypothetical protein SLEP1_g18189 [Rubroshorea leprosula]
MRVSVLASGRFRNASTCRHVIDRIVREFPLQMPSASSPCQVRFLLENSGMMATSLSPKLAI